MKYFGGWKDREAMALDFNAGTGDRYPYGDNPKPWVMAVDFPTEDEIVFASYGGECYDGDAVVFFYKAGKLFEVRGSHCSCYGLEDQWEPEETDLDTLRKRNEVSKYGYHFLDSHDATAEQFVAALGL